MNKKKSIISLLIFVLSFAIGFSIYNGYYYLENIYNFNLGFINKSHISKVSKSQIWDTIEKHYSNTLKMDINTYEKIYATYSACDYMDNLLQPYYEQYGYDSVLASGLESKHKIANVYSYEKCCEIIGEKKINKEGILKYLKKSSIDEKNYSGTDNEKKYIDYAKKRLDLAISLMSGSTSADMIATHSSSNTYCWIANSLRNRTRLRFYHKGDYLTATNHYIAPDSQVEFASQKVIKVISTKPYAVYISDDIVMYDINYQIAANEDYKLINSCDLKFSGNTVSGNYYHDTMIKNKTKNFTLNLKTGKIELSSGKPEVQ